MLRINSDICKSLNVTLFLSYYCFLRALSLTVGSKCKQRIPVNPDQDPLGFSLTPPSDKLLALHSDVPHSGTQGDGQFAGRPGHLTHIEVLIHTPSYTF